MTVHEGGKWRWNLEVAGVEIIIDGPEELLEGIGEALIVAAGVAGVGPDFRRKQGGVPDQALVGLVALAGPEFIGLFVFQARLPREPAISKRRQF